MSEDGVTLPNLRLEAELGRGGTAIVYRARQLSTGREVAVKVLDADFVRTSEDVDRFLNEAKAAARFRHRNIVRVYDVGQEQGVYYFVMELVEGYTFAHYLRRKGQVAVGDVLIILEAVCAALQYAWQKFRVVHCDIKPDNLMVDADGTVKVMDLGIARSLLTAARGSGADAAGEIMGTPAYISPDQVYDLPDLDCRADIYALGATAYHLLTGSALFPGKTAGVWGTTGTLKTGLYTRALEQAGVKSVLPGEKGQQVLMDLIYRVKGGETLKDRAPLAELMADMHAAGADYFILGCTELPIVVEQLNPPGDFVDPTAELARAAIAFCLE